MLPTKFFQNIYFICFFSVTMLWLKAWVTEPKETKANPTWDGHGLIQLFLHSYSNNNSNICKICKTLVPLQKVQVLRSQVHPVIGRTLSLVRQRIQWKLQRSLTEQINEMMRKWNHLTKSQMPPTTTGYFKCIKRRERYPHIPWLIVITFLFSKFSWPGDSERRDRTFRSSSQGITCPPVYNTWWMLHTVPVFLFHAERQAGKLCFSFYCLCVARPGIELQPTV